MIDFEFSLPTEIRFGRDAQMHVGELMTKVGSRVLIHYGSDRIKKNGLLGQVENQLCQAGISYWEYGGVQSNPSVQLAQSAVDICRGQGIDSILAIGGGSVMDSAKAIALGACSQDSLWDLYSGKGKAPERALPIGVIVTLPATGSEANGVSVLSNYETKDKRVFASPLSIPRFALLNPELTLTISTYDTAIAAADIFSHCFERYFDLRRESKLWDSLCEATMRTIVEIMPDIMADPQNYQLRCELMWAATVAHSNMLGVGGDFACHGLAHPLTSLHHIPHGAAMAITMLAWSQYMKTRSPEKFILFAKNVWNANDIDEGLHRMETFLKQMGLPLNLDDAGVEAFQLEELSSQAFAHGEDFLGGGLEKVYPTDARSIYEQMQHCNKVQQCNTKNKPCQDDSA